MSKTRKFPKSWKKKIHSFAYKKNFFEKENLNINIFVTFQHLQNVLLNPNPKP
jgi:hypothetical protein